MKTYIIPVTHTATTIVEHSVQAKNMQDAMFQLGKLISESPDPFDQALFEPGVNVTSEVKAGSPTLIADDETLDLKAVEAP